MRRKDLTELYEPTPDPLASVERLLLAAVESADDFDLRWPAERCAEAREAVRLLMDVARNVTDEEAAPSALGASVSALLAFARGLSDE